MKEPAIFVCLVALLLATLGIGFRAGFVEGRGEGAKLALQGKAYLLTNTVTNTTVRFEVEP